MEGLGRRVVGAAETPHTASLAASLDDLGFQVDRDTVLQTGAALLAEAHRLEKLVRSHRPALRMQPPAGDLVSGPAADEFNTKIQALADQCEADARVLTAAAVKLADDARRYGFTEQEITAVFGEVPAAPGGPGAPAGGAPGASG